VDVPAEAQLAEAVRFQPPEIEVLDAPKFTTLTGVCEGKIAAELGVDFEVCLHHWACGA
jgi:hypothetical protein